MKASHGISPDVFSTAPSWHKSRTIPIPLSARRMMQDPLGSHRWMSDYTVRFVRFFFPADAVSGVTSFS
jgi:hypothetical protein